MFDVSVIIVNWNVSGLLARCLASLQEQRGVTAEIFVIDNASSDGSTEMVRSKFPSVRLIANKQNRGFAAANNQGLREATGRHLFLLNPDTIIPPTTLASIVRYFDLHANVGVIGPQIRNPDGTVQASIRRNPDFLSQALVLLKVHAFAPGIPSVRRYFAADFDYFAAAQVEQVMGAALAFRRKLLNDVGLFDEEFFLWFEEVDFCRRAQKTGWKIQYIPDICITHVGGQSFQQLLNLQQQIIFDKSLLRYFAKHGSAISRTLLALLVLPSLFLALFEPFARRFYAPKPVR